MSDSQNKTATLDFTTFLLSVASAAYMGLGMTPRPGNENPSLDLSLAKQNIDLLELMKDKTKSNLTPEESRLLDHLLFETRMRYVEAQKK